MSAKSFRNVHIVSDTAHLNQETILTAAKQFRNVLSNAAFILHDKDVYTSEEALKRNTPELKGQLKPAHYHIVMAFKSPVPVGNIANAFGIPENFIGNVSRSLRGAFQYLIHVKNPEKYQYDPSEVHATFDYPKFLADAAEKDKRAAESKSRKAEKEAVDNLCRQLATGEIKAYQLDAIDPVLYSKHKSQFDNALNYHALTLHANGNDRNLDVIFITGGSGTGKTTYAKALAKKRGLHYYLSGGNRDPLENYRGEECIIFDDLRGSSFKMSELLNILDNNTFSPIGSRYHNKTPEASLIIITSITAIEKFYESLFESNGEPLIQLKRRCATYIRMDKDNIHISKFDSLLGDYRHIETIENPIPKMFPKEILENFDTEEARAKIIEDFTITSIQSDIKTVNDKEAE